MANPHRLAHVAQLSRHRKDVRVARSGHAPVQFLVHRLEVEHHQISDVHQPLKRPLIRRIRPIGLTRRIQHGVHAPLVRQLEQRRHKFHLEQRFAAADGDAAALSVLAPVFFVAQRPLNQGFRVRRLGSGVARLPRIGVVAELAAHRAALQKDHIAHAGAVHKAEALDGVHPSDRLTCGHGRCGR